jgi:putative pyruvate formate lyase activating enzyme
MTPEPAYLALLESGELKQRVHKAYGRLQACDLCPRACGANRLEGELGDCRTAREAVVASYHPHFGEEAPLVGYGGSGTIFFAWCNLHCCYCQNYELSQLGEGSEVSPETLATMMLHLQDLGCHNVNLVSPSHVVPQILAGVLIAAHAGLRLPLVYNTGGYDSTATLALLDGVIDIYMPDIKYADAEVAERLSGVAGYPGANRTAIAEMHRQVGDLVLDDHGIAQRGLLVRHLVLPAGLGGTAASMRWLADAVSTHTYVNVMDQYRPCYRARELPELRQRITREELAAALRAAREAGLCRLERG